MEFDLDKAAKIADAAYIGLQVLLGLGLAALILWVWDLSSVLL